MINCQLRGGAKSSSGVCVVHVGVGVCGGRRVQNLCLFICGQRARGGAVGHVVLGSSSSARRALTGADTVV